MVQIQTFPSSCSISAERCNHDASSGAGELSDSMSVGEVAASSLRKRKSRVRVRLVHAFVTLPL